MKRVVVTGGSGFVGRHCLPQLVESGYDTHVLSKSTADGTPGRWHQVDLMDGPAVAAAIQSIQPTHLLHLAWMTEPGRYLHAPENLEWLASSLLLVKAFHEAGGQRAVVAGSCAEYDWNHGWCTEDLTPLKPQSLYGQCKTALYSTLSAYARQVGLSWGWGRLFFLYGPYGSPARIPGVVIESLLKNQPARCSQGLQVRDFLHITDAAQGLVTLLNSEFQGPVNIASGEPVTIREIVLKIADYFGRVDLIEFGAIPSPQNDPPLIVADVRRLRNELGWSPSYNLTTGLAATIEWRKGAPHGSTV